MLLHTVSHTNGVGDISVCGCGGVNDANVDDTLVARAICIEL